MYARLHGIAVTLKGDNANLIRSKTKIRPRVVLTYQRFDLNGSAKIKSKTVRTSQRIETDFRNG